MAKDLLAHLERPGKNYQRLFVAQDLDLDSWDNISEYFAQLEAKNIETDSELTHFIQDFNELMSVIQEEGARRYINMTCFTNDEDNAHAFRFFAEELEPKVTEVVDKLQRKLVASPALDTLNEYFQKWIKDIRIQIELFRKENIAIETKVAIELQDYQKVTGSQTIELNGEELTLAQANKFLEEPDEKVRQEVWEKVLDRRFQDHEKLNQHFETLFQDRLKIAQNCGFDSFVPYIFKAKGREDYSVENCREFHQSIEEFVVPLYRKLLQKRAEKMGKDKLKPWDLAVDPESRPPLRPFANTEEFTSKAEKIFGRLDPQLGQYFADMRTNGLLDLESRIGKAPGGYQCGLEELRLPFIFMNAVGTSSDVSTLMHEAGHSFHQYLMQKQELSAYRDIMAEIAEVASMSMELVTLDFQDEFYSSEELSRVREEQFEDILRLLPWVATVDAFQIWMYENPVHTVADRNAYWLELRERFGPGDIVDSSGYENKLMWEWQRQLHIFEVPFYYIEYGIAQLGALQVWQNYREDSAKALDLYKKGLSLGGSRPLPELYEAMGIQFDFSASIVKPLVDKVWDEIRF